MTEQPTDNQEHASAHGDDHGVGHLVPAKFLIATCLGLLFLTFMTVAAAKIDFALYGLPDLNIVVAMVIAVVKATLVCLFFMHLFWDRSINAYILVFALAFVGLFIAFAMTDTFEYRSDIEQYQNSVLKGGDSKDVQDKLLELQSQEP